MSSRADALRAVVALTFLLAGGCYRSHLCESEEACDLFDNDCDGRVDEGFRDADGVYRTTEACGHCGVICAEVFPTAAETACVEADDGSGPICLLTSCGDGFHPAGDGACAPDVMPLCLPCSEDSDCALRLAGARCLLTATGASRCGTPCDESAPCSAGFGCDEGQCRPRSGICACGADTEDTDLACLLTAPDGRVCVGVQRCGEDGPTDCEPALEETCNGQDDDCDGTSDEDFRDALGRYVSPLACGGCGVPCVAPGPNMRATCTASSSAVSCSIACEENFVDVDRIAATGCECSLWNGEGPPPVLGGDSDCDGVPDSTTDFVYVAVTGSDANPGSLDQPLRTLPAALRRARLEAKSVLVSRGIYDGEIEVVPGVSVFGGYSPDFRERDLELYPVLITRSDAPGLPPLTCRDVVAPTRIEGLVVQAGDATQPGAGSTAILSQGCGATVHFTEITVLAGRASDGVRGADSSSRVREWGLSSLRELDGRAGSSGAWTSSPSCGATEGGQGGTLLCRAQDVSGGAGGGAQCPGAICSLARPCANAGCTDFTVGGMCDIDAVLAQASPNPAAERGRGNSGGAAGELTYNAPTNRGTCSFCDDNPTLGRDGGNGADGLAGVDGRGGIGCTSEPVLDAEGRLRAGDGTTGTDGTDGSGGGGATAGSGYEVVLGTELGCSDRAGGSGGGGGSGGCGAPAARGGGGGGASVGIVVRARAGEGPTFADVRVVTASGGRGGDGGTGAAGGAAGTGAQGGQSSFWCARSGGRGGDGGRGGAGGGGGGGCGGGSHGVFLIGGSSTYREALSTALTVESAGVPGQGGRGGFAPSASGSDGASGANDVIASAP